jgi:hypothetical protein
VRIFFQGEKYMNALLLHFVSAAGAVVFSESSRPLCGNRGGYGRTTGLSIKYCITEINAFDAVQAGSARKNWLDVHWITHTNISGLTLTLRITVYTGAEYASLNRDFMFGLLNPPGNRISL